MVTHEHIPNGGFAESMANILSALRKRVSDVRDSKDTVEFLRRVIVSLAVITGGALLIVLSESLGHFPTLVRTILVYSMVGFFILPAIGFAAIPLLRRLGWVRRETLITTALSIGSHFPSVRDRLSNILELGSEREHHAWVSSELIQQAVRDVDRDLSTLDLTESVDRRELARARKQSWIVIAAMVATFALWPGTITGSVDRLIRYETEFTPPRKYNISITPGDTEVAKGSDVSIMATVRSADGEMDDLPDVALFIRQEGQQRFERAEAEIPAPGVSSAVIREIRSSSEYFALAGGEESERYHIAVLDWPSFQAFRVHLKFPSYSKLSARLQDDFSGNISALAGTRGTISGRGTKELASGELVFSDSARVPLRVEGMEFSGSFIVSKSGSYVVRISDTEGLFNRAPIEYDVRVEPDVHPIVAIVEPGRNIDVAGHEPVGLVIEATDDYGISRMLLRYRLSQSRYVPVNDAFLSGQIPLPADASASGNISATYQWTLDGLDLVPEDVVEYFVEAFDNDDVNGPKSGRSQVYTLRLPSLEEVFSDLDAGHEQGLEDLGKTLEDAKELKKEIEEINKDLKTNKEFDWQDQQEAKEMSRKVEDIRKKLEQTQEHLQQMTDEMQRQQVLSPETMEKYLELQNLFQQINSEEFQQALKTMQQAMEGMRRDQMQQAMQRVEFSEERFRKGIERTVNLLKRIQVEQKMDEVRKRSEELAGAQEELGQEPEGASGEQAKRQDELAAEQRKLEQAMKDLQERMEEFFTEMPADKLSDINTQLQEQQLDRQMSEAAQQMRQGNRQRAQRMQQNIRQNMENLSQQLGALQQELLANQTEQMLNALRRATNDLLELSRRQENVKNDAQSAPSNSPSLRQNAQDQMSVMQDLNNVAAGLSELAQKSFAVTPEMGRAIGEAMQGMQNAMRDLDTRNGALASQDQTAAMASLNKAAQKVQESLQAMMQGAQGSPGGMGLMQQLQMMAGQQMRLNAETQGMREGAGGEEAMRRAAEAARIAGEQDAVRKSLEQLQKEAQSSQEGNRILGDLDRIAQEMKEVVRNLEQNNIDPGTLQRQERILSRLLDASRSMRERDFEKKREATTGRRFTRRGPESLQLEETRSWLRQEMLRALERGYSRDYQDLIRKYFEELEKTEAQAKRQPAR